MTGWARQQDKMAPWDKKVNESDWKKAETGAQSRGWEEKEGQRFFKLLKEHWAHKNNAGAVLLCVKSLQITQ